MKPVIGQLRPVTWQSLSGSEAPGVQTLTEARVDEAVPHAATAAVQPAALQAGGEAEGGAARAHQHVADADVEQHHVDGRPQALEAAEQHQHQQVVEEAEHHDGAEAHRHHHVTSTRQPLQRRVSPFLVPFLTRSGGRLAEVRGQVEAAQLREHVLVLLLLSSEWIQVSSASHGASALRSAPSSCWRPPLRSGCLIIPGQGGVRGPAEEEQKYSSELRAQRNTL